MGLGIAMSIAAVFSAAVHVPPAEPGAERLRAALAAIVPAGVIGAADRWRDAADRFAEQRPELVLIAHDRASGAELELGALGGGRAEAPSLLHVGLNIGF
jgi:hypothetical protein